MSYHFKKLLLLLIGFVSIVAESQPFYWGITNKGGTYNVGTIFYTDESGNQQSVVHSFNYGSGDSPIGSLILAADNQLYGTTPGGNVDYGTIFQFDKEQHQYQKMVDFNGSTEGYHPTGHLVNFEGVIYGMSRNGGEDQSGVIFEYVPGSTEITIKKYFTGSDGAHPEGGLTVASNGLLYGLTSYGGETNLGVLFVFDPDTDEYEVLHHFNPADGAIPVCNLLETSNGKLYGVTPKGGDFNSGVLFEFDIISETFTKLVDFDGQNTGSEPAGSLIQAQNGLLYGMSMKNNITGGDSYGTIYSYDIVNFQLTKLFMFDGTNGAFPTGSLTETESGKLIGLTDKGGVTDSGVRFEFDPLTNSYTKKIDFTGENGRLPIYGSLLEVGYVGIGEESGQQSIKIYPNPANDFIYVSFINKPKHFEYILYTLTGQLIKQGQVSGNYAEIEVDFLTTGTYLLELKSSEGSSFNKILIK